MTVIPASKFVPTVARFGAVEKNKMGGKFVPIVDENGQKLRLTIQTPALSLPFGVSAYRERPDADVTNYSVDVSFRGMDKDPKIANFLDRIRELDNHMLDSAVLHSKEWYGGKQKSREVLEDSYRKLTKEHPEGTYAPVMKIKIPIQNGKPNCSFFDVDKKPIALDDIPKGATVKVICEVTQVWFVGSSWGITWRALQVLVVSKPERLGEFAFQDDEDSTAAIDKLVEIDDDGEF